MFQDLDDSLASLIRAELALVDMEAIKVSFASPDDQFPPTGVEPPVVSFFLYDIREDTSMRHSGWEEFTDARGVVRRRPQPVRVTCSYLITAWPSPNSTDPAHDEHQMLGEVLKVLLRYGTIPNEFLHGDLMGQNPPMPTQIISENQLHSLGEFWQAMGGRPKASLHYGITVSLDVADAVDVDTRVRPDGKFLNVTSKESGSTTR